VIEIDGSYGEGGGQILRTSVSFAALFKKDIRLVNIRAKRDKPGIRPQHRMAIQAVASISRATVRGNEVGSSEITFAPGSPLGGNYDFDIGTAGSVTLVLQSILPVSLIATAPTHIRLIGGTDVPGSPTSDYFENVLLKAVRWLGGKVSYDLRRRGYYPRGGGVVDVHVEPSPILRKIGSLEKGCGQIGTPIVRGKSHCSRLPSHVSGRQALSAKTFLQKQGVGSVDIVESYDNSSLDPGSSLTLWLEGDAIFVGSDSLGARGKRAEEVGREAADGLVSEIRSDAPLDSHMGDMILPYLSLCPETSQLKISRITMHLATEVHVAKQFGELEAELEGDVGNPGLLRIRRTADSG